MKARAESTNGSRQGQRANYMTMDVRFTPLAQAMMRNFALRTGGPWTLRNRALGGVSRSDPMLAVVLDRS
jgi:hypothetical protein